TFKGRPAHHWCDVLATADVCCMPALKPGDALWLKQTEDNGLVDILPDGQRQLGKLAKYSRTPIELRREVPMPGQHNRDKLGERSEKREKNGEPDFFASHSSSLASRVGPLDGMLVLDFGAYM